MSQIPTEKDKPFFLAILSMISFMTVVGLGVYGLLEGKPEVVEFCKWAATTQIPLVSMAWAFYFKAKS